MGIASSLGLEASDKRHGEERDEGEREQATRAGAHDPGLSVWFVPDEATLETYREHMHDLREAHGGSVLWPAHLTAFSPSYFREGTPGPEARCRDLAARLRPFDVETDCIASGNTKHQNVFVRLRRTPELVAARLAARSIFGGVPESEPDDEYDPHISLVYGSHDPELRAVIVEDAAGLGVSAPGDRIRIEAVEVWRCIGPTNFWKRVARAPLRGSPE